MEMAKMSLSDAVGIMYSPPNICANENQTTTTTTFELYTSKSNI